MIFISNLFERDLEVVQILFRAYLREIFKVIFIVFFAVNSGLLSKKENKNRFKVSSINSPFKIKKM